MHVAQVMMFGMTGAGKSALGNLIAGSQIFDSGAAGKAGLTCGCLHVQCLFQVTTPQV